MTPDRAQAAPFRWTRRHAIGITAAALLGLAAASLFAEGGAHRLDRALILWFRDAHDLSDPLGPAWFQEAVRDMTAFGSFVGLFFMTTAAALALWLCGYRRLATGLVASVLMALLVSNGLKIVIARERPDIVTHAALTFTASFPSGHAFLSAAVMLSIAGFVGLASQRDDIALLCLVFAWVMVLLIGLSRIYLGVHWPTDVLGGWCLGIVWSSTATAWFGRWVRASDPA